MSELKTIKPDTTIKFLLAVIAILLGVIAVGQMSTRAEAQISSTCGLDYHTPCLVRVIP
ncbi:MAG: hypothetical protein ACAH80_02135 [Alphaproteobacteria bacterium]